MTGPRRNQARRGTSSDRNRDAHCGRWGDDGWPGSQARRSANGHCGFLGAGRRFDDGVESRDVTDGNAVRRVDGGVLNVEWAGGITAKRSGGKVFNRDGGHRSVKRLNRTRVVHARYVAAEVAEVLTGERER